MQLCVILNSILLKFMYQDFATRPHAIFSTLQGTQNPDTKPTLPRAKNANAQPTHSG
jgi:hypothetical protein